ncbi:MAG: mechanosensitive ion channel family protein [Gammaproteobacteria bacterium]|nr:mechanosensitive ion channel family protein [Gammaproteobacteria bacterium]MDH5652619.1 mechanosensitive ion channel family protein [Gammaproteobacteria bacterium]
MKTEQIIKFIEDLTGGNSLTLYVFAIVFAALLLDFVQKRVLLKLQKRLEQTRTLWDDVAIESVQRPISFLIWLLGISLAAELIGLKAAIIVREVGFILIVTWALIRFIGQVDKKIIHEGEVNGKPIDRTTADAVTQLLKVSVIITAGLVLLESLGFDISAILAFGGIGGVAVGFASKDLLANFFGAVMIYLDRPFSIGDWIRSPDKQIEGTVERIGWRLTVIRTFDKRPLYVPNSVFASIAVENPSRMTNRRIYETIGVRYDDADKLPVIVADVEKMLKSHPEIDQDQTLMVNFNEFAASSLDFFVYTFTKTTNWQYFHQVKQDVLFKINGIITGHGAEIAFPTSTVHLPDPLVVEQHT